jgi:hypothetical protein
MQICIHSNFFLCRSTPPPAPQPWPVFCLQVWPGLVEKLPGGGGGVGGGAEKLPDSGWNLPDNSTEGEKLLENTIICGILPPISGEIIKGFNPRPSSPLSHSGKFSEIKDFQGNFHRLQQV